MDRRGNRHHPGGTGIRLPLSARGVRGANCGKYRTAKSLSFQPDLPSRPLRAEVVQDVRGLVDPAPLLRRRAPDLAHRLPEAQGAVADRQRRLDVQASGTDVEQQFLPRLLALPVPRRPSISRTRLSVIPPSTGINIDCSRPSKKIGQPLLKALDSLLQLRKRVLAACHIRSTPQFLQLQGCLVGPLRTEAAQRAL